MFVRKIHIDGFGKFVDKDFQFGPGLNVVYGPNESGKTTLSKFLLYSLTRTNTNVSKYKPWGLDVFGGYVETSDGRYIFGDDENTIQKYEMSVLENVAFLLEDDDLETIQIDKNILESSLRKKTEKSEEGRLIKEAIRRAERLNLNACLSVLNEKLKEVENEISAISAEIKKKNEVFVQIRKLLESSREVEREINELNIVLGNLREGQKAELQSNIFELRKELESIKLELSKYSWIESMEPSVVEEIQNLMLRSNSISAQLDSVENEERILREKLEQKERKIEDKLRTLGATSQEELESVGLRLKHLNLLSRMYSERVQNVSEEEPLWKVFLENPNILDDVEEEEQRYREEVSTIESQKLAIQDEIERNEARAKYSRDLAVLSTSAGIVLFVLGLLFKNLSIFMYAPSALFLLLAVLLAINWKRKISLVSVLQEKLLQVSMSTPKQPQTLKILSSYGIGNIKQLRKKYAEFLEWKVQNVERQRQINELKDIEQEIIRELSKFGVTGAAQMIVSAVENLQRVFNELQEVLYEKETLERKITQLRGEYLSLQKEYKNIVEVISAKLENYKIGKEEIELYRANYERYQTLKTRHSELTSLIRQLNEELDNEDVNPKILELKIILGEQIRRKGEIDKKIGELNSLYSSITVDKTKLSELFAEKDILELRIGIIGNLIAKLGEVKEFLNEKFEAFVQAYHTVFNDKFVRFFDRISGMPRNFVVMPDLSIKIVIEGDVKDPGEYLSGSTKDLLIFAIKDALYKTFYDGNLPLVIDNTLIRFDDDRLKRICEFLRTESDYRQIILLTSDRRILDIFKDSNVHMINLEG
ncbi:AAA family ATPase [Fervidobacterium gondwanense]|uniref:AAA family ATPase n=1 Tax=Fervidobacterium gondwanense TaxID=44754 RepID=UPI003C7073B5